MGTKMRVFGGVTQLLAKRRPLLSTCARRGAKSAGMEAFQAIILTAAHSLLYDCWTCYSSSNELVTTEYSTCNT